MILLQSEDRLSDQNEEFEYFPNPFYQNNASLPILPSLEKYQTYIYSYNDICLPDTMEY